MPQLAAFPKAFMDELCLSGAMTIRQWIELAATLEVPGLEFYSGFLELRDRPAWRESRQIAADFGMTIPMLCCSPDFTHPDAAFRHRQIEQQIGWIEMCAELGGSYCRVLSGQRRPEVSRDDGLRYAADSIKACLPAAAERGVVVRALFDSFGSSDTPDSILAPLRAAGGTVTFFSRKWRSTYLIRNHQKLILIDGHTAMTGGFNIAEPYLGAALQNRFHYVFLGILWLSLLLLSLRHFRLSVVIVLRWLLTFSGALMISGILFYVLGDIAEKRFFTGNPAWSEMLEESIEQLGTLFILLSAWVALRRPLYARTSPPCTAKVEILSVQGVS